MRHETCHTRVTTPAHYNDALQKSHVPPQFKEHAPLAAVTTLGSSASKKVKTSSHMMSTPNRERLDASTGTTTSRMQATASKFAVTSCSSSARQPPMLLLNCNGHFKPAAAASLMSGNRGAPGSSSQRATINVVRRCSECAATPQPGSTQCSRLPSKTTRRLVSGDTSHPLLVTPPTRWSVMRVGPPHSADTKVMVEARGWSGRFAFGGWKKSKWSLWPLQCGRQCAHHSAYRARLAAGMATHARSHTLRRTWPMP